jgi:hypothetical protein
MSFDSHGWNIEGSIRFDSKIESMKVEGDFAYLNLMRGERPIIDIFNPASPEIVGFHNISSWVSGIEEDNMRIYRKDGLRIEVAVPR